MNKPIAGNKGQLTVSFKTCVKNMVYPEDVASASLYGRKTAIVISEGYIGTVTCWIATLIRVNQSPNAPTVKYEQADVCTAALP
ncbi:hypothetical protein T4D_4801 [Trichinella pseudospiralis]|uniref:Uncharacterized protein n=1 Tax=Trichinella pseudospiralis TaxID=6337 RepID=A0A0V1FX24_TRIPS|nr:hypothetical protein T4D_4801 [Trichinella pseudospiralis]